jgi:N-methylhydantoinase A
VAELRDAALADLAATGVTGDAHVGIEALMRYREQLMHSLEIPVSPPVDGNTLLADFDREYVRRYGGGGTSVFQAVEVFALRARVSVPAGIPVARPEPSASTEPATTDVYWPGHGRTTTDVYRGAPDDTITGPALVELAHTTVAVPHGATLTTGPLGELHLKEF